ncbi:MAG: right-handed parallel beta-helix repeat-containing protein [Gemmatimonadetes bacterium]|nr:right-handed parallel beta-helix repeat-containing protein [Gemmatimonadota bacterium]
MRLASAISFIACVVLVASRLAGATTYHLNADGTGDFPTIADAAAVVVDGDVILLADGVYSGPGNTLAASVREVELRSESGRPGNCEIHGRAVWRGLIDGIRFVDPPVPVNLRNATIRNCEIVGGPQGGLVMLYDCVAENVSVRDGGQPAVECYLGFPTITGCTIESNAPIATSSFATLNLHAASGTIENCRIAGNRARYVGGINAYRSTTSVRGCTIVGNEGDQAGGLRAGAEGQASIEECTIANNRGGFADGVLTDYLGSIAVSHSIVWSDCGNSTLAGNGSSIDITCSDVSPITDPGAGTITLAADVISLDPLFCAPEDCLNAPTAGGTYTLDSGSPAVAQACGAMGSLGVVCGTGVGELDSLPWSRIKALHR